MWGQIRLSRFFLRFFLVSSYGIRAMDYFAFAVASLLLFAVAIAASYLPAAGQHKWIRLLR